MALDNVTSHFSTMLEPITSASFLSSLSIIHMDFILSYSGPHAREARAAEPRGKENVVNYPSEKVW